MIGSMMRRAPAKVAVVVAVVGSMVAAVALAKLVDGQVLAAGLRAGATDPVGMAVIGFSLWLAFGLRAKAWCQLLPGLSFGHSIAGVHLALGANHVLPFRLGESLRILSVVRRARIAPSHALSTTVLLRSADVVALALLGIAAGSGLAFERAGLAVIVVAILALGGIVTGVFVVTRHEAQTNGQHVSLASKWSTLLLVFGAWLAEAIVVWEIGTWFGLELTAKQAVGVLAVAVLSQVFAITPGGIGTYEAAASATLVGFGVPFGLAVTMGFGLHAVKTVYSLIAGGLAALGPQPSMVGRLRLANPRPTQPTAAPTSGPVVLFLPARNEQTRVGPVLASAPQSIRNHKVELVVVDDGSTDATVEEAHRAGAVVVSHNTNLGLGAAVRTGLSYATTLEPAAVAFCDADGEYDPSELEAMVAPILDGEANYVVGSRFGGDIKRMHPHRWFGNKVLTQWVRFVTRTPISDGQSGFRAFSASAAESALVAHDYNYAQVLTVELVSKGFGYTETPITYSYRTSGQSFIRLGTYLTNVVPAVWRQLNPDSTDSPNPNKSRESNATPIA